MSVLEQLITSTRTGGDVSGVQFGLLPLQSCVRLQNDIVRLSHQCIVSLQVAVQLQTTSSPSQTEVCGVQFKFTALATA